MSCNTSSCRRNLPSEQRRLAEAKFQETVNTTKAMLKAMAPVEMFAKMP